MIVEERVGPVWTLRKKDREARCVIHSCGEHRWEARSYRDRVFFASRRFALRADAIEWAEDERRELEQEGWISADPPRPNSE
jgi:hypothetical protein